MGTPRRCGPTVTRAQRRNRVLTATLAATLIGGAAAAGCDPNNALTQTISAGLDSLGGEQDRGTARQPSGDGSSTINPTDSGVVLVDARTAAAQLDSLPVKGRAPKTGYSREQFGQAWSDDVTVSGGHNGCDTRNDVLAGNLVNVSYKAGTNDCVVLTGTLADPYTGSTIDFVRGQQTSGAVQIDHIVALSDAWQKGAQRLSPDERRNFANDPRNLVPVDGPTNASKGDGDAATWLPPNRGYRCEYVSRQIEVKAAYRLWVTAAEKDAMSRVLGSCSPQ